MARVAKIAVSIDKDILRRVERVREATGESRSAIVARALALLVGEHEKKVRVAEYLDAYRRVPEQPSEVELARQTARRSLASVPWEAE